MIIDAQHHYFIPGYEPIPILEHVTFMDRYGINAAVLTNNIPSDSSVHLRKYLDLNDKIHEFAIAYPDRFIECPSLPLHDGKEAIRELDRVVGKYGVKTVVIRPLHWRMDEDHLLPLYERLNDSNLLVFMHPVYNDLPVEEYYGTDDLAAAVGFAFNTSLSISRVIFSGLLEKFENLKLAVPHLGGALPFIIGRLDAAYDSDDKSLPHRPSVYLKRLYFDTVSYRKDALELTAKVVGPDRLIFGTDYGCPGKAFVQPKEMLEFVRALDMSPEEKESILGGTVTKLLRRSLELEA